jgi:hypothetical protein
VNERTKLASAGLGAMVVILIHFNTAQTQVQRKPLISYNTARFMSE